MSESYVSASVGISFYPDDADNLIDLIKNADQAMYSAKMMADSVIVFLPKPCRKMPLYVCV